MILFNSLVFKPTTLGTQATLNFPNGYGASVITGGYGSDIRPYEIAVIRDNRCCYSTPITSDVLGHLNAVDVEIHLNEIEALPNGGHKA
jgi:hypothetical protein